jgi:hypothetical protein
LIIEKAGQWRIMANIARPSNNGKINPATGFLSTNIYLLFVRYLY